MLLAGVCYFGLADLSEEELECTRCSVEKKENALGFESECVFHWQCCAEIYMTVGRILGTRAQWTLSRHCRA